MVKRPEYGSNQLRVLYYLKQHGPLQKTRGIGSLYSVIADSTGLSRNSVRFAVKELEDKCVVLCTWSKGRPEKWGSNRGSHVTRIELIDPAMKLPAPPKPLPAIVVDARINEELYQITIQEPSLEETLIALLERNEELQEQVNKLQDVIVQLSEEQQKQERGRRPIPEHLTSRVRNALKPEQWDALSHSAKR